MSDALAVARAFGALHAGICIPDYEKVLTQSYYRFLRRIAEPVLLDVGAHAGLHLEQFALLGRVIAFEPIPEFAQLLRERYHGRPNIEIRQMALGREAGMSHFVYLPQAPQESGLRLRETTVPTVVEPRMVEVDTLDRQCVSLDRLTYIKLDVEGAEIDCLLGGQRTTERFRPLISVEYGKQSYAVYGHSATSLFELAGKLGYVVSDLFGNLIESKAEWLEICDVVYWDYFLVPVERLDDWRLYFPSGAQ